MQADATGYRRSPAQRAAAGAKIGAGLIPVGFLAGIGPAAWRHELRPARGRRARFHPVLSPVRAAAARPRRPDPRGVCARPCLLLPGPVLLLGALGRFGAAGTQTTTQEFRTATLTAVDHRDTQKRHA